MNKSKAIVITGVSTGIGHALTRQLLDKGYRVFGSVRKPEDATKLKEEFREKFTPLIFDVTDYSAIESAVTQVEKAVGEEGLAGLINNAGIAVGGPALHVDIKDYEYQFQVNVFGLVKCIQAFAPLLGASDNHTSVPGRIINIGSVSGKIGMPFVAPYVGSKFALEGLSHSFRRELLLYGIDVILIGPGPIKTPIWQKSIRMEPYYDTPYGEILKRFENGLVKKSIERGFTPEYLATRIINIFEKRKPKPRYTMAPQALINYHIPRLLPHRVLDKVIKKLMRV